MLERFVGKTSSRLVSWLLAKAVFAEACTAFTRKRRMRPMCKAERPKWSNDTLVSFSVRKKAGHWVIVPGSISTMHLIPTG
jgi:hypothetical protein